jgi:hypothetical protein
MNLVHLVLFGLIGFLLLFVAVGRILGWHLPKRVREQGKVYACEGTTKLFWYRECWNVHGHRRARQDWWCEVVQVRPGVYRSIEPYYKDNVGYYRNGEPPKSWCYPYREATAADIAANAERSAKFRQDTLWSKLKKRLFRQSQLA